MGINWFVFHSFGGDSFFTGIGLVLVAVIASTQSKRVFKRITVFAFLVGVIEVVLSSTAIPCCYYALTAAVTVAWIASFFVVKWRRWSRVAAAVTWLGAGLMELPHHIAPSLLPASSRSVTVIGDSVTAGLDNGASETWPRILARDHALQVQDISHPGETTAAALKRARAHEIHSPVVIVEIGGNDLLGSTTSAHFARDLDALLAHLSAPGRQIIMFELPLPPFYHGYGRAQRVLAKKYNVKLVPRRIFLSILVGEGSTLDSLHLSPLGHQQMASCVWQIVRSAF